MKLISKLKDPGSAITHFIGVVAAIIATVPLLIRSFTMNSAVYPLSMMIFMAGMILLYGASTLYHSINISPTVTIALKKFDHLMIFMLIAGTYTPMCLIVLSPPSRYIILGLVWGIAIIGMIIKFFWVTCPRYFSSILYIAMGWVCVFAFPDLVKNLSGAAFGWLLAGGIIYTVGGVIYALKLPIFNLKHKHFGSHEIFHLFCLGGSFCHYILMYHYVVFMPVAP